MLRTASKRTINWLNELTTPVPRPFLGPLFEQGVEPEIATGFEYHQTERDLHGVEHHRAIDLNAPRGTAVLAPADGYYLATYTEYMLRDDDGSPVTRSLEEVQAIDSSNTDIDRVGQPGDLPIYFGSYVIQGWHGKGRYTQYGHVDWVDSLIPFYAPQNVYDKQGKATNDLLPSAMLRAAPRAYVQGKARFVEAGQKIAEVGMTGCGWGKRCYDFAEQGFDGRPDFRHARYPHYTPAHLHFAVFGRRAPFTRDAKQFDPFGIYGQRYEGYPTKRQQWNNKLAHAYHQPLWLAQGK